MREGKCAKKKGARDAMDLKVMLELSGTGLSEHPAPEYRQCSRAWVRHAPVLRVSASIVVDQKENVTLKNLVLRANRINEKGRAALREAQVFSVI